MSIVLYQFYKRHFWVFGIRTNHSLSYLAEEDIALLDVRDYIEAHNCPCEAALNIPYPYLKRNFMTIPFKKVFIIAEDKVTANLTSRLLKKNGFKVVGFFIMKGHEKEQICVGA
jgi:rhodanese-related sulfurtransferase